MTSDRPGGLGMGCNKLGSAAAGLGRRAAVRLVQQAVADGITFFDTADVYGSGTSEQLLGAALRGRRSEVELATKGGYLFAPRRPVEQFARAVAAPIVQRLRTARRQAPGRPAAAGPSSAYAQQSFDPDSLRVALEASLRRLRTDYVDIYQLHGPEPHHVDRFAEFADRMRGAGSVRAFGVGLNNIAGAAAWLEVPGVQVIQLPLGILDPEAADSLIPRAQARGIRVVVRGIYGAGLLSPRRTPDELREATPKWPVIADVHALATSVHTSAVQLAAWFVREQAPTAQWIIGINNPDQLRSALATFAAPMPSADVLADVHAIVDRYPHLLRDEQGATGD